MKNKLQGINSRLDKAEGWINDLEDKVEKHTLSEQKKEKQIF